VNEEKNGSGMWPAIGMILVLYNIPLVIYKVGVGAMRFIMAILCSMGVIINIAIIVAVLVLELQVNPFPYLVSIIGLCIAALSINFIWFFVAFRPTQNTTSILNS